MRTQIKWTLSVLVTIFALSVNAQDVNKQNKTNEKIKYQQRPSIERRINRTIARNNKLVNPQLKPTPKLLEKSKKN